VSLRFNLKKYCSKESETLFYGSVSLWMKLRMRDSPISTDLNSFQQAARISLKQNTLKIGHFY